MGERGEVLFELGLLDYHVEVLLARVLQEEREDLPGDIDELAPLEHVGDMTEGLGHLVEEAVRVHVKATVEIINLLSAKSYIRQVGFAQL